MKQLTVPGDKMKELMAEKLKAFIAATMAPENLRLTKGLKSQKEISS